MSWTADLDPRLADVAEQLETTGSAAEIYDPEWRLVYLTSQFRFFAGDKSLEELGVGRHAVAIRAAELHGMVPDEVELRWLRTNIPLMAHDTPGGADAIRAMLPDEEARGRSARSSRASRRRSGGASSPTSSPASRPPRRAT